MGISLGYFLAQKGVQVEVFEASPAPGGLAGSTALEDGTPVDRFYHAILSSDTHLQQLCSELDIADQLRFRETGMGFYYKGHIYSMNSVIEFLRFPPLGWIDRFRLGLTVLYAQFVRDWHRLERVNVEEWLIRWSGLRTYENIWRPLLKAKFDGDFTDAPATYIWARLVRMKSTRQGTDQKEQAGHLIGGYTTLIKAMADRIEAAGGAIHLRCPVREIVVEDGRTVGVRVADDEVRPFRTVAATTQLPIFRRLIPNASQDYLDYLGQTQYLGIIAPLLVLNRPLTGNWTLNITDDRIPFTGVVETTAYIDPQYVSGNHLVYLPKYTAPGSRWQRMSDGEIRDTWLQHLERMFPDFDRRWIRYFLVYRERYVEPLHGLNQTHLIPAVVTPVRGLYLATTAQIYPALTNCEAISRHTSQVAQIILKEGPATRLAPDRATKPVAVSEAVP
jgi:protoporphyrinogen oxidase